MAAPFSYFFLLLLPAFCIAMAIACFCGVPERTSVLMFFETVSFDLPFFSGTSCLLSFDLAKIISLVIGF